MADDKQRLAQEKIEKMYKSDRSHGFVMHLIHAYLPVQIKASKIFESGPKRCAILNEEVLTADDVVKILLDDDFVSMSIRGMFDEEARKQCEQTIATKRAGREVGYSGENTTTFLSQSALVALQEFAIAQMLMGDREMERALSKMRLGR